MSPEWSVLNGTSQSFITSSTNRERGSSPNSAWSITSGLGGENPSARAIVPSNLPTFHEPSFVESLARIVATKQLTKIPKGQEMSGIDRRQEQLINGFNNVLNKFGLQGNVEVPFKTNIEKSISRVSKQYTDILPETIATPTQIDRQVDEETRSMVRRLENGNLDSDFDTTDDERKTAYAIREKIGYIPPEELRVLFVEQVYGRASDITSAQHGNRLAYHQQGLARSLSHLKHIQPQQWYAVDLLTNMLMLTPHERKDLENIIWSVTPGAIHIRDINHITEDYRKYPLEDLARGSQGIIVQPGTVDYVDKIRGINIPFLQPSINKWAQADIGGIVFLRTLGREEPAAKLVVREPISTSMGIQRVANIARDVCDLNEMMLKAVRNPEAAMQFPIRPNKVRELLPDPIVLQMGVIAHPDGTIDYSPAIQGLEQRKNELQASLRAVAISAAVELDAKGNPPKATQRAIRSLERAIERTENVQNRLNEKNRKT